MRKVRSARVLREEWDHYRLVMTEEGFLRELQRLGIPDWTPGGSWNEDTGVWNVQVGVPASFPETGIDVFDLVDAQSFWFHHRNEVITHVLQDEVDHDRAFLEVGSGSGVVVDHIRRATTRPVASVEPLYAGAAAVARRGVPLSFCGDLEALNLPPKSVAALGAFDVIEHLTEPEILLSECLRVIANDGRLILTVPAYQWLWSDHDVWNEHVQRFTLRSLRRLLRDVGFEPVTQTYLFAPLVPAALVVRVLMKPFRKHRTSSDIETALEDSLAPTAPMVDRTLRFILGIERSLLRRMKVPFGTSVLMTARPRSSQ